MTHHPKLNKRPLYDDCHFITKSQTTCTRSKPEEIYSPLALGLDMGQPVRSHSGMKPSLVQNMNNRCCLVQTRPTLSAII